MRVTIRMVAVPSSVSTETTCSPSGIPSAIWTPISVSLRKTTGAGSPLMNTMAPAIASPVRTRTLSSVKSVEPTRGGSGEVSG